MKSFKKVSVLVFALALVLALSACGTSATSSASSSASSDSASSGATTGELYGKPWVTSVLAGNLPAEKPEAKDDVYTHYNYEYLAAHQSGGSSAVEDVAGEPQAVVMAIIKDESKTGHDLEQLRIFYNQAADTKALQAAGLSEVQPFLDRIDAVSSLDEMNALLTAEDFPFSPFITACLTTNDTRATNIVAVLPNFMLTDALLNGGTFYQDSDDPQVQQVLENALLSAVTYPMLDLMVAGMDQNEVSIAAKEIIDFEKAHGKYLEASDAYLKADYGAMAEEARNGYLTLDEMCSLAPNIPLKGMLDKVGKGGSETYAVTKAWLEAFNNLWTEDNLDKIKLAAKVNVLGETRPYRDPSYMNALLESLGMAAPDSESFAYTACCSLDTLANVVAMVYVDNGLGPNAKDRLTKLSQDIVAEYKNDMSATPWMGEETRQNAVEKLDHMTLNILEPEGGYFDYSGIDLTPTDQGGTLFSNYLKLKQYRYDCESKLVGQPVVKAPIWFSVSPTKDNAFYDVTSNSINIFPGSVTSLIYTDEMSDNKLLAVAGWIIAHEITHGFDYSGSQFDAYGQPNPVYSDADVDAFLLKSSMLALYYQGIEIMPGQMVDGQSVIGEAVADLCGSRVCLEIAAKTEGFDSEEYFASISHSWAEVLTEPELQEKILDVHPLNNLRVNVSLQMNDAIYNVLGVAEGDTMYLAPEQRITFWGPNA